MLVFIVAALPMEAKKKLAETFDPAVVLSQAFNNSLDHPPTFKSGVEKVLHSMDILLGEFDTSEDGGNFNERLKAVRDVHPELSLLKLAQNRAATTT